MIIDVPPWRHLLALDRLLVATVGFLGLIVTSSWVFVGVVGLSHRDPSDVPGVWMALAAYVNHGSIYPALYDGVHYGGTRYMPLFFLLHGSLARLTGEYLVSGHIVAIASGSLLLGILVLALRRIGCTTLVALGFASLILLTPTGMLVTTTVRADALPSALQLGGLYLASRRSSTKLIVVSALPCALAVFAKSSALWAPLAIGTWLALRRRWRDLALFAALYVALVGVGLIGLQYVSDGRFLANITALTFTGSDPFRSGFAAIGTTLGFLRQFAPLTWALIGLALASLLLKITDRAIQPYDLAFVFAVVITFVVISDPGTGHNQLIDIVALTVLLVGELWKRVESRVPSAEGVRLMIATMVLWTALSTFALDMRPEVVDAAQMILSPRPQPTIGEILRRELPGTTLLSEDPAIPVLLGRLPVVLDPWVLLRFEERHPSWVEDLADRIAAQEFDAVLLRFNLEDAQGRAWYRDQHFGSRVVDAIEGAYCWSGVVDGFQVYTRCRPST
jgi:hypothetical protein